MLNVECRSVDLRHSTFKRHGKRGFSLLELLVVLVLLGFLAGVAVPSVGRFLDSLEFKKRTDKVMTVIRYARVKAVSEGSPVVMTVGEGATLSLSGAVTENKEVGLGEDDTLELEPEEITFSPEGYATPGQLSLTLGERTQKIIIDPLSGLPLIDYSDE